MGVRPSNGPQRGPCWLLQENDPKDFVPNAFKWCTIVTKHLVTTTCRKEIPFPLKRGICALVSLWKWIKVNCPAFLFYLIWFLIFWFFLNFFWIFLFFLFEFIFSVNLVMKSYTSVSSVSQSLKSQYLPVQFNFLFYIFFVFVLVCSFSQLP